MTSQTPRHDPNLSGSSHASSRKESKESKESMVSPRHDPNLPGSSHASARKESKESKESMVSPRHDPNLPDSSHASARKESKESKESMVSPRHDPNLPDSSHASAHKESMVILRKFGRSSVAPALANGLDSWHVLTELGRQQMAAATLGTSALWRGSETLRKAQQEMAHEASLRHAHAAKKLSSPCQPTEMIELQGELVRSNIQSVTQYWRQLLEVALQTQREMMESMTGLLDSKSDGGMKSALEAFQSIVPPMATSFFAPNHHHGEPGARH